MGTLKRKQGKGTSLTSHYKDEVQCWVENKAFFLSDGEGGSDKWDLEKCQLRPPRSSVETPHTNPGPCPLDPKP
eukprot:3175174-Rhodomonas_salina.2